MTKNNHVKLGKLAAQRELEILQVIHDRQRVGYDDLCHQLKKPVYQLEPMINDLIEYKLVDIRQYSVTIPRGDEAIGTRGKQLYITAKGKEYIQKLKTDGRNVL